MSGHQRENIAPKYESIYKDMARVVRDVVAAPGSDANEKYRHLKLLTASVWHVMSWMMQSEERAKISPSEQDALRMDHLNEVFEWMEGGTLKHGSRIDYIVSTSRFYAQTIRSYAGQDTDLVLDLGCGWGHRLIDVYLAGMNAFFVGGDRSFWSRDAVAAASSLFPEMRKGWFQFDFLAPDFSPLPDAKKVCIFSFHAIEQVTRLGPQLFDKLLERYPNANIIGVHLEPIAGQFGAEYATEGSYARDHGYNIDLLDVVRTHPRLREVDSQAIIHRAGSDTTSLLVWQHLLA